MAVLLLFIAAPASGAEEEGPENYASFGPDGTEASNFQAISGVAVDQQTGNVYVLDGKAGTLSKFEADGTPLNLTGSDPSIEGNKVNGLSPIVERNSAQVAVDQGSHVIYATTEHSVSAFQPDGEPYEFVAGPGAGTNEIPGFGAATGVAVDSNGTIYVSDSSAGTVSAYAANGEFVTSFTAESPGNLGISPEDAVYVDNSVFFAPASGITKFTPSSLPVSSTTTYEGKLFIPVSGTEPLLVGIGVDPVTGNVDAISTTFATSGIDQFDSEGNFVRDIAPVSGPGHLGDFAQGIAVVGNGEEFQLYAGNTEGETFSRVEIFGEEVNEGPPAIQSTSVINVTAESATLRAGINPDTAETTYRFEYGLNDCSLGGCATVPVGGAQIEAGHKPVLVLRGISGLAPGSTYHYRVVAENSFGISEGPDRTFTTQPAGRVFALADTRAWELVSPARKFGGALLPLDQGVTQAAADGSAITYQSKGSLEAEPSSSRAPDIASLLARRGPEGWSSKDISPPHTEVMTVRLGGEYKTFSEDLSRAALEEMDETELSPEASERTPYLRINTEPPSYKPLVTGNEPYANVPPGTEFGGNGGGAGRNLITIGGANAALTHIVISSIPALVPGAPEEALYEWAGGQLHPVSVMPPAEGGEMVPGEVGSGIGTIRNGVSEDGSRVFWSLGHYAPASGPNFHGFYLRDTETEETARLDVVQPGASGGGETNPSFQGASADGTTVFFTDSQQLTPDASSGGGDLYSCEIPPGAAGLGCSILIDLSPSLNPGEQANVGDPAPVVADDGKTVYFVAGGVLDSNPNGGGESAIPGGFNLYVWRKGSGTRFIANLAHADAGNWGQSKTGDFGQGSGIAAAGSPNGRYFVFMSERSLTGYANQDALSGEPDQEVFRYDAFADRLICVSCNPTGASPSGELSNPTNDHLTWADPQTLWAGQWVAADLPEPSESEPTIGLSFYHPRAVFDSGRVFFNAVDSLVPSDSNSQWDAYEYEPTGTGDCSATTGGASVLRSAGGCVALISSGSSSEESVLLDASETGDDAFFVTSARLSALDEDNAYDVYDARIGGVVATRPLKAECLGEACQPTAQGPGDQTPASAVFSGKGNVKHKSRKHCPNTKRKVKRKGKTRCVPRRHAKKPSRKAGKSGRAAR